jgi:pyruvate kinase
MKRYDNLDNLIDASIKLIKKELKIKKGDKVIIASGHPTGPHGSLNLLKIHTV